MDIKSRGRRNCEPRILRYRKHVRFASTNYFVLSIIAALFSVVLVVIRFFGNLEHHQNPESFLNAGLFCAMCAVAFFVKYWFFMRPMAISKIQIFDDHIRIRRNRTIIKIPYAAIKEIKSAVHKNVGGWFTIVLKNKNKYRFTVTLERVEYVLEGIYKARPELMAEEVYLALRQKLILSDHSFGRLQNAIVRNFPLVAFYDIVLPAGFIGYLAYEQLNDFVVHDMVWYFAQTVIWILLFKLVTWTFFVFMMNWTVNKEAQKRLEANPKNKKRDMNFESQVFRRTVYKTTALTALFCGFYYMTGLNTKGGVLAKTDSKEMNLEAGKTYSYDVRYNCFECKYKLNKTDIVWTENGIGRVVGLPSETVVLNSTDKMGRSIASTKEHKLPSESAAIQVEDGRVMMVKSVQIYGKIIK